MTTTTKPVTPEIVEAKTATAIERTPAKQDLALGVGVQEVDAARTMSTRPREENLGPKAYEGAGKLRLTEKQTRELQREFPDDVHEIKPTDFGEVYVPHQHVRRRLNQVLGAGTWTLVPVEFPNGTIFLLDSKNESVYHRARLYVRGCFVAEAVGEQRYHSRNPNMSYASACEGSKSDALVRCCKDLSIGWECWDKRWTSAWRKKYAIRVVVKGERGSSYVWRRKDADRLRGEDGGVETQQAPPAGPTISKSQIDDLWALATEVYGRRDANAKLCDVLKRHGCATPQQITPDAYRLMVAEIEKAR